MMSYLNLQFNYIPAFHRSDFLSLSVKRKIKSVFNKTAKVSPMERWDVIKMKGMIAFFNGNYGDLIYIYIAQIFTLKEYFSITVLACKCLQKFANWNSCPTYSAI